MFYTDTELKEIFKDNKEIFDKAYEHTKERHNDYQANFAMAQFLVNYETQYITNSDNDKSRDHMKKFLYHGSEIEQFLIDYAISSYIFNDLSCPFSLDELHAYSSDPEEKLKYDKDSVIAVVAGISAENNYYLVNILSVNHTLKESLVKYLIEERYIQNRRNELDNTKNTKSILLTDGRKFTLSKSKLNKDIDNMIRDDERTYYKDDLDDYQKSYTK